MSIIVMGMEMPKDCDSCWIPGLFCSRWLETDVGNRHQDCPLGELPEKHGRLIDADALEDTIGEFSTAWEYGQGVSDCWDALIDSPTIVEAEGD